MKVTYYLGAGASVNAIPAVNQLENRFDFFSRHIVDYASKSDNEKRGADLVNLKSILNEVAAGIANHYTIDTYAKKLFLKKSQKEYFNLEKCLTAFFLYEQLKKDRKDKCHSYIRSIIAPAIDFADKEEIAFVENICKSQDYRYDSFFATLLKEKGDRLTMPEGINIISWNYDFQIEIAYSNYSDSSLNETGNALNIYGALGDRTFDVLRPGVIN